MQDKLQQVLKDYLAKIQKATSLKALDELFLELFAKNGVITQLPHNFPKLPKEELREVSPLFNQVKAQLEREINDQRLKVKEKGYKKLEQETLDLSQPTKIKKRTGHLHPITKFNSEVIELFKKINFAQFDSPQIDTDYNIFESLNIPSDHPARDLWDTLYIDTQNKELAGKVLLRTHTTAFQNRVMKKCQPPIRMINVGRCFRYENLDARHEHTFDQFDLVYVDKDVTMANLQYLSEYFLKAIFGSEVKVRMRPKYYPFVEPGVGIDGECIFCKGKARLPDGQGCKICGGAGWLELAGAGMIHPFVLKEGGLDPNQYSGLAWGFGPFRMAMIKFGVNDIRIFNSGNLKELYR